jgi:alkane 1-monooxygenase
MRSKDFFYIFSFLTPSVVFLSFELEGWGTFLSLAFVFIILPILDILCPHLKNEGVKKTRRDKIFLKALLYLMVAFHCGLLLLFLEKVSFLISPLDIAGMTFSMGLSCGILGINVGHELGHRTGKVDQLLAHILLMTSLYMHFLIEHYKGHHQKMGTWGDPATARKGESFYSFFPRCLFGAFISAWQIERKNSENKKIKFIQNKMILYLLIEAVFILFIALTFSLKACFCFCVAAFFGAFILEITNYIEHYGLVRKMNSKGNLGKVGPNHSWNSSHLAGNLVLFNLGLHSDHHINSKKGYQDLEEDPSSPQLPTGYVGCMLMSLFPPLWFWVMNKKLEKVEVVSIPSRAP